MIGTVALFQRSNRYFINDRDGGKHLVWERIDRPKIRQVLIRREAPLFEKPRQWETDVCWSLLGRQRQRGQPAGVSYICPYNTVVLLLTTWTLLQMTVDGSTASAYSLRWPCSNIASSPNSSPGSINARMDCLPSPVRWHILALPYASKNTARD